MPFDLRHHAARVLPGLRLVLEAMVEHFGPVGRALLLSIGLADRAIQIEDQLPQRLPPVDLVDPLAGEIHERREILLRA